MTEPTAPPTLDQTTATPFSLRKREVVDASDEKTVLRQFGATALPMADWPGWPDGLHTEEAVIETFVARTESVLATSDNKVFNQAWAPAANWMNETVRRSLRNLGYRIDGDAYLTASLTPTVELEGLAHLDDDQFMPDESVGFVAIVGQLAGPRIATAPLPHAPLRPMMPLTFDPALLDDFSNEVIDHVAARADQLVIFAQFGQLHAGPAARHVAHLANARQLLVLRGRLLVS